ncbi:MAG: UDP-N-acetylglucosamine 1-carboxyvinyltransferase, partial [Candidatus Magasanikbacteria bacterium]|nr:UDP-N-acetylglucosamine 1-carboxyvinyltransferase [Candidatus Magasanikbacteria bacterium]
MSNFVIEGGKRLLGEIVVSSGKNSPIALLFASLMVRGRVTLRDMSRVEEVSRILEIFQSIGVAHSWVDDHTLFLDTAGPLRLADIDKTACARTRVALLFFGALAAREKQFRFYRTGGCDLGERTIRPHLFALAKLGVEVREEREHQMVASRNLRGAEVVMYESGDTATENVIMAAALARGATTIRFASANYMVQDLCYFLAAAGARIDGIGTTTLKITGVPNLHDVEYAAIPDPVDAMAWISLAITTHSRLTIRNCAIDFLALELEHLSIMGQRYRCHHRRMSASGHFSLVDITIFPSVLKALPDKLHGRPYPGLNIDNVPLFVPILTQAAGQTLVHDWVYENRAIYYLELQKLGARVLLLDPHRVLVSGSTGLRGNELICPPALRPGMAILIAMLASRGKSV